ncbi:nucleotide-binding universal stress UspA family protein [Gillisia sp. Hel_I_86]|uniref:universal stress protein n=1 Tax=Gillisia sp. Hel_I_86 TaxID=1249981 RepID=UPI00119AE2DD|nr:universal stress protein [Gillisia sp. Hel_I_86]TVZ27566.1 nucleotide-binding universal stress UspA family protein [Gillisia sp. Hel_I_86]
MKHILVPTDFSQNAYSALHYATQLFKNETATFYLVNSFEANVIAQTKGIPTSKSEKIIARLNNESQDKAKQVRHKIILDTENKLHKFEIISTFLDFQKTINNLIKSKAIDYVVMGTKGATGAKDVLFGSNTVKAIKKLKGAPLLMIPNEMEYVEVKRIGFATDFTRKFMPEEIAPIIRFAKNHNAVLRIIFLGEQEIITETQRENIHELKEMLYEIDYKLFEEGVLYNKTDSLLQYVMLYDFNILAMVHYKHSFLKDLLREPVIKMMGLYSNRPYLVIPAAN